MTTSKKLQSTLANAGGAGLNVEDVFSTYLYEGTGSSQTITNGIDLDGEGGLVWIKSRTGTQNHWLFDDERSSFAAGLRSDTSQAEYSPPGGITSVSSDGFSLGNYAGVNPNSFSLVSWTFRKAPKFFDVVTYTGDGVAGREIAHNLGSVPGCIIVKSTSAATGWPVYHKGMYEADPDGGMRLDSTAASTNFLGSYWFGDEGASVIQPTDTVFTVGESSVNESGQTYVAYLFAHNDGDGEFGESGDQDIIKCGRYIGDGSSDGPEIDLGFEPQWVIVKNTSSTGGWYMFDIMRGMAVDSTNVYLRANESAAEDGSQEYISVKPNGFQVHGTGGHTNANGTYIYIAIRRGPMKTPESGTEVFSPTVYTGNSSTQSITGFGFAPDLSILKSRVQGYPENVFDRLRGATKRLLTPYTNAEDTQSTSLTSFDQDGITIGSYSNINTSPFSHISWNFKRAPGFFDVVCYEGDGTSSRTVDHNLGVVPEMIWVKRRNTTGGWYILSNATDTSCDTLFLERTQAKASFTYPSGYFSAQPTETIFSLTSNTYVNASGSTYVAYLFASLSGISKVGSYTGNGTSQTIDCGFSSGARFVLIKRTDSTGDWHVWDTERGIVAGNDPFLEFNETNAENTSYDSIDPDSSGFIVNQDAGTNINVSSATYIFYAIA